MISIKSMQEAEGKNIKLIGENGKILQEFCYCYHQAEDDGEEPALEIGKHWLISQSEIKSIEILD